MKKLMVAAVAATMASASMADIEAPERFAF
jgi:hypothetical protein